MGTQVNTNEVAAALGTQPRILRQFLRSPSSPFKSVGSGARYEFSEDDLPVLSQVFTKWSANGKPKATRTTKPPRRTAPTQHTRDQGVWLEEEIEREKAGLEPLALQDIRNPRVRKQVLRIQQEQEERLDQLLMAAGMHITQRGDRR